MELHIALKPDQPLREQIEQQIRDGVLGGRLQAGIRLPPSRLLAVELGVSRGVVVEAYAQLTAEGYLQTHGSGGTRVAAGVSERGQSGPRTSISRPRFDLRPGLPDTSLFPRRVWAAATADALRDLPDAALLYGPPEGYRRLRRAIASYLGRVRAIAVHEQETLITCGSGHAFALLWSALRGSGTRRIAYEDPAWERIPATIAQAGLEPVPVRADARGLSVAELRRTDVAAVVVSPAHQYPTGVIMHPERRAQLIAWARKTGALVVEDDYDAEYRFGSGPIAPLRSVAPDCVAYVGTTSKVLAPDLRLGWLLVPAGLAATVAAEHSVAHAQPSVINQAAFAALLENGDVDRHLRRTRAVYRARRAAVLSSVNQQARLRVTGGAAGLHLMAWLPEHTSELEVVAKASRLGVAVEGLHSACAVTRDLRPALVVGYGAILEAAIPGAIALLGEAVGDSANMPV